MEEAPDPAQIAKDMERLELIKKKRCALLWLLVVDCAARMPMFML